MGAAADSGLGARTNWATDMLGREMEVQYNADHRVIAYWERNGFCLGLKPSLTDIGAPLQRLYGLPRWFYEMLTLVAGRS